MPHDSPIIVDGASVHLSYDEDALFDDGPPGGGPLGHRIKKLKHSAGGDANIVKVTLTGFHASGSPDEFIPYDPKRCKVEVEYQSPEPPGPPVAETA